MEQDKQLKSVVPAYPTSGSSQQKAMHIGSIRNVLLSFFSDSDKNKLRLLSKAFKEVYID